MINTIIPAAVGACFALCAAAFADEGLSLTGLPQIIDGDTFSIGPATIRIFGIDAPEAGQKCLGSTGDEWSCGDDATARLADLIDGREITCRGLEADRYGRIISECSVDGKDIGRTLVAEGTAWAFTKYSARYATDEEDAKRAKLGIWSSTNQTPWDYRADRWNRAAAQSPVPGCPIKEA